MTASEGKTLPAELAPRDALAQCAEGALIGVGGERVYDDAAALADWLGFVQLRNAQTARSYRTEVMRFRIFLETIHRQDPDRPERFLLRDATEMDIMLYEAHLRGTLRNGQAMPPLQVPASILMRYGKTAQEQPFVQWRKSSGPFEQAAPIALKPSSVNQAIAILHALYERWLKPDPRTRSAYVGANPAMRIKRSTNRMQRQVGRCFPIEAMHAMLAATDFVNLPHEQRGPSWTPEQMARQRWIAVMLFGLWGRRAEIANIRMSDFSHDGVRWMVRVTRKGGKVQSIPVANWIVDALVQYRQSIGLPDLPQADENFPCIQRLGFVALEQAKLVNAPSAIKPVHPDLIYREVEALCRRASRLLQEGHILQQLGLAQRLTLARQLDQVSPHWFRHSGASIAINTGSMTLNDASAMLGHSSSVVTDAMYIHRDARNIADAMEKLGALALAQSPAGEGVVR